MIHEDMRCIMVIIRWRILFCTMIETAISISHGKYLDWKN